MPQVANYGLLAGFAFVVASAVTPQGRANASEYSFGTHAQAVHQAEGLKSEVWQSVRTPPVMAAIPSFIAALEQRYDLTLQATFSEPLRTQQGRVPPFSIGAPQADPSQIAAEIQPSQPSAPIVQNPVAKFFAVPSQTEERPTRQVWGSQVAGKTPPVIPIVSGSQVDPTQIAARVWQPLVAPPIVPNPLAGFFSIPGQFEERPTRQVWPSQLAGKTPPVIASIWAAPQLYDFTQQARIIPPALAPVVVSYAFRSFYGAPQLVDLTQQAWIVGKLPASQGRVRVSLWASQADPSQIAAKVFRPIISALVPGVFPSESPVHFRASPGMRRLGESTEQVKSARLGEPTEKPDPERLGSSDTKPPGEGLGS